MKLTDPNKPRLFTEIRHVRADDIIVVPHHDGTGFTKTRVAEATVHGGDATLVLEAWPIAWSAPNDTHVELIQAYRDTKFRCLMCRDESSVRLEVVRELHKNELALQSGFPMVKVVPRSDETAEGYCATHADAHFSENPLA